MENWVLVTLLASAVLSIVGIASVGFTLGYLHGSSPDDDVQAPIPGKKPNILFIMFDDMGYNDISWNNPNVITPNMEKLARSGVILNRNYVHSVCSPSRGEFLTGKYAHRLGLQKAVVAVNKPGYIPLGEKLVSERLQDLGYTTHLVGKWHAGNCRLDYFPTRRGFDSFYGSLNGYLDSYTKCLATAAGPDIAMNWYDQEDLDYSHQNIHVTDLVRDRALSILQKQNEDPFFMFLSFYAPHIPIQVPKNYSDAYSHIEDDWRKEYLGMITQVDEAVGQVVAKLKTKGLLNDTIIVMTSDNGAYVGPGSNFPLRGTKVSTYEGGTRVPGFISGPPSIIRKYGYINNERFHMTDWLPTLVSMAHGYIDPEAENLDGIDQSSMLSTGSKTKRREMVYNINTLSGTKPGFGYATISYDNYKLIVGSAGRGGGWEQDGNAGWFVSQNTTGIWPKVADIVDVNEDHVCFGSRANQYNRTKLKASDDFSATPVDKYRLFDVQADPEERVDLAAKMPEKVQELKERLQKHLAQEIIPPDRSLYPISQTQRGGAWVAGWC